MTGVISIDFETRSEEDLQRVGSWKYSRHPSSDITCIGWHIPGQPQPKCAANSNIASKAVVAAGADLRELLWYAANTDIPFEAHGAPFERSMWENTAVPRYGWPQIAPERWRCTMARARGISLPGGLEKAAEALRLSVSKDMEGSKIMRRMCKPQKGKYGGVKWVEDDASFLKLMAYCAQDVRTEMALSAALPPLSPTEFCIWRMDQAMNHRGIAIDRAHVESCVAILDEYNKIVNETVYHLTNGALKKVTEVAKALRWCISRGVVLPDLAANTIEPYLTVWADTIPEDVAAFLKLRYFAGKSSTKKYQAMLDAWDVRDYRVRNHINYCGAQRTRRFSGAIIQPQNYPRGVKGLKLGEEEFAAIRTGGAVAVKKLPFHLMDVMATGLRGSFVAGPGKVFYGGDLANIEVRVLFWLAGEEVGLDAYRRGEDLYILVAADIYGVAPADVTEDQRQMGKQVVLGCGFQMWFPKFRETCLKYKMDVSEELAKRSVLAYREKFVKVVAFWYAAERAAANAMMHPGKIYPAGRIAFSYDGNCVLRMHLPSTDGVLHYLDPKLTFERNHKGDLKPQLSYKGVDSVTKQWVRQQTYGGKLVENATQAVARDAMCVGMIRLEEAGYLPVLQVHDEPLTERDEGTGCVHEVERLMTLPIVWAPDLPLKAKTWTGKRYVKQ